MEQKLPKGRAELAAVIRAGGDTIDIATAAGVLGRDRTETAKTLSRWVQQGWLRRIGSGVYAPASLDSLDSLHVLADPWVAVPALFAPCYVGGRTAAEHWDLTEQIFRDIVVLTTKSVRQNTQSRHGAIFTLRHIRPDKIFGTRAVWRGQTKVLISDVHRTIIDMLDDPALGGGIQHVSDCWRTYLRRPDRDDALLVKYAEQLGNGAVFKRMGFLAEREESSADLVEACRMRLTAGTAKLDPAQERTRLVTRWNLWVPETWLGGPAT